MPAVIKPLARKDFSGFSSRNNPVMGWDLKVGSDYAIKIQGG